MSGGGRFPRPLSPAGRASSGRLRCWKEIASYLARDERTVRRWEKSEGLPVHRLQHSHSGSVFAEIEELDAWTASRTDRAAEKPETAAASHGRRRMAVFGAFTVCSFAVVAAAAWIAVSLRSRPPPVATPVPLTTHPGRELEGALSPDGREVAYAWDGESGDHFDIYVQGAQAGAPRLRLTSGPADEYSPAWSPDGLSLAFLRQTAATKAAIVVVPRRGGVEKTVAEIATGLWPEWGRPGRFLAWAPGGQWLIAVGRYGPHNNDRLLRIDAMAGEPQAITSPPATAMGDTGPAISPDRKMLAFSRRLSWGRSELCVLPLSQDLMPDGEVHRLDTGSAWNASPAWMPDGRRLIFSTGGMQGPHLARIAVAGPAGAERLPNLTYGWHPSTARMADGRVRLVYTQHYESVNLWRLPLDSGGPPVELARSAHWSYEPDYSPDGTRIAFLSDRTGEVEVWASGADGRNPQQWTFLKQPSLGAPRWSPDSRRIAFTAPGDDGSSIYLIDSPGQAPRRVAGSHRCGYLAWSPDGRALYFSSDRAGVQIWKVAAEGGEAVQVTSRGGRVPAVSPDGRFLYYLWDLSSAGENHLFRLPLAGGQEESVLQYVDAFSVSASGIGFKYYRAGNDPDGPYLRFFRFADGRTERLPIPVNPLRYGVAVSPDGRFLAYAQADFAVTDLMLVDGLR